MWTPGANSLKVLNNWKLDFSLPVLGCKTIASQGYVQTFFSIVGPTRGTDLWGASLIYMCVQMLLSKSSLLAWKTKWVNFLVCLSLTNIFVLISFRCPVGKYWHYHGERCNELVSMPVDPPLIVTCLVGSLCLVCAVLGILIFINKKCLKTRKAVTLV